MVKSKRRKSALTPAQGLHGLCAGCLYTVGAIYKGYCEYCREEYGTRESRYAQAEDRHEANDSIPDEELDEMTDGEFVTVFGYGRGNLTIPLPTVRKKAPLKERPTDIYTTQVPLVEQRTEPPKPKKTRKKACGPWYNYTSTVCPRKARKVTANDRVEKDFRWGSGARTAYTPIPVAFHAMVRERALECTPHNEDIPALSLMWGVMYRGSGLREFQVWIDHVDYREEERHCGGRFTVLRVTKVYPYGDCDYKQLYTTDSLQRVCTYIAKTNSPYPRVAQEPTAQQAIDYIEDLIASNCVDLKTNALALSRFTEEEQTALLKDKDIAFKKLGKVFLDKQLKKSLP